ncbi:MAG: AAA family ATPase, partial [Chloroflexi bacterium]|nr:AAA family ATPase [Chloroflexota bacterium]
MQAKAEVPPLKVYTLGRLEVYRGEEHIDESSWKWRKAKDMLLLLLLAPNHRMLKEKVLEWLWPEQEPARASNNLHRTLFVLRRILQPDLEKAADSHYIWFEENCLILNSDAIAFIDFIEFERLIQWGYRQGNNLHHFEDAYALYRGEFLPDDLYEAWTITKRNNLESTYLQLIKHLARGYKKLAEYTKAIEFYQILVNLDSIDEEVHRELMRLYTQVGQRHRALQLYKKLCEELLNSFHATPSPETGILYDAILNNQLQFTEIETVPPTVASPSQLAPTIRQTTIIGRDADKQQLHEFIQQAKHGQGTVVLVEGEAGIGKTCLVEEAAKQAQAIGFQVMYGRIYEQEGSLPYSPFIEIIRAYLTPQLQELLARQNRSLFQALAYLLPELGDVAPPNQSAVEMGQARQHLFDAISLVFLRQARENPLLFVLEDIHLASESTLQLLHYLARHIANAPILLVCTIREEAMRRGQPINRFYFGLQSNQLGQRLHLQRLSREDTELLCVALVGDTISRELCQAIYQLTEGNPFFIRELVFALIQNRQITLQSNVWQLDSSAEIPIPANIQVVIGLRLEQMRPEAYQLAEMAAVVGEEFEHELLQLVTDWPNEKILDLLDDLFNLGIIKESGEGYRF